MKIGYARVSTVDQKASLQTDALRKAGCQTIYVDHGRSGASLNRPELKKALKRLKSRDVLIVWKLDRLGRSLRHLIDIVEDFKERKVGLRSLTDSIDTTSPHGRMVFQIMGSLAEFERELTIERTRAGLAAARGQAGTEIYSGAGVEGCEACP
jgi:DNA invertase Pin-like site-specific DNA recombinase